MIKKLLIANRGEIAVRVIRSAREMGIAIVAVFSEPDRLSPHVLMADEAFALPGKSSQETYLDLGKILKIAKKSGADAIHPGYGFLSENADFVKAVKEAGIIFVGPAPEAIEIMGDKTAARQTVSRYDVPLIPGLKKPITEIAQAIKSAGQIGYPILVKAAGGGGGKGMHLVREANGLEQAVRQAQREAKSAFGDDRVYLEKYVDNPHHIEIQILADKYGHIIHLNERECSIQRRYQKIIEETPSPLLTPEMRKRMGEAAVLVARSCQYEGAGTVEFLADELGHFYFLEMNTRLQVEHPVTEMVSGIDLVKMQLLIAAGERLPLNQEDIQPRGHAIEARIYAEDPGNDFAPCTGIIEELWIPDGPGIRFDGGIRQKLAVSPYYDPMLGKLIAWDADRKSAIARLDRALSEFLIAGIDTSIPFCRAVLRHREFQEGRYDTQFLEKHLDSLLAKPDNRNSQNIAAIAASVIETKSRHFLNAIDRPKQRNNSKWRRSGRTN
ncbi:MAG TPA: acetyl-CoA carboxylase biotin carboxylase subunit [Candidatus Marinimicrobia bacterium]|nr:acetyl-CoA carboxylase biotin carboxylase subunit [Candidatus Neomarinimicrobiota bacterium]